MKPEVWCWAYSKGKPVEISLADLRSALSRGEIRSDAWVWRRGHRQWLPANRIRALAPYLRGQAKEPFSPSIDPDQVTPPSVPSLDDIGDELPRRSTPVPPPTRSVPLPRRPKMATLDKEEGVPSVPVHTIVPPGAVPPPPRIVPKSILGELGNWEPSVRDPNSLVPSSIPPWRAPTSVAPQSSHPKWPPVVSDAVSAPLIEHSAPLSMSPTELPIAMPSSATQPTPPPSAPIEGSDTLNVGAMPVEIRWEERRTEMRRARRIQTLIGLGLGVLAALAVTALVITRWHEPAKKKTPPIATTTSISEAPWDCRIVRSAQRIAARVSLNVQPIALEEQPKNKLILGFAESATTAAGIVIDPEDLSVQFPYREPQAKKVISVTPVPQGHPAAFVTTREGIELSQARAITNGVHFLFGVTSGGLSRQLAGQPAEVVFALPKDTSITDPRIASISGLGHAITFRRGGTNGSILLGYLTVDGQAVMAPEIVASNAKLLGTPTVAVSIAERSVLVAFAGRNGDNEPWSLHASLSPWGNSPSAALPLSLPEGGPGADAISPTATSLPSGHWLLQWSEGPAGQRQVRVLLLDSGLRPMGPAHTVSPADRNSGQGLLWSSDNRAVSVFIVSAGKQSELWATSLTCSQ